MTCRSWTLVTLVLAGLFAKQSFADTTYFGPFVNWSNQCLGGPVNECTASAARSLDFVWTVLTGSPATTGTTQLTAACNSCGSELEASLTSILQFPDAGSCPLLAGAGEAGLAATALRRFVCWGATGAAGSANSSSANTSSTSGGGDGGAAGSCVVQVVGMLEALGILDRVRSLDPGLRFQGDLLAATCAAIMPPAPPPPGAAAAASPAPAAPPGALAPGSCCGRSWAYLQAALAQAACLPGLAAEYLALTGRCEALLGRHGPGFCEAGWPDLLRPLLAPPPAARCAAGQPAASPAAATPSNASSGGNTSSSAPATTPGPSPSAAGPLAAWTSGAACPANVSSLGRCPQNACELWCGLLGTTELAAKGVTHQLTADRGAGAIAPGTAGGGVIVDGTGLEAPPPPPPGPGGVAVGTDGGLRVVTVVIICVFSVLSLALLAALISYMGAARMEKRRAECEAFQFDRALTSADAMQPPPMASVPSNPIGKTSVAYPGMPALPTSPSAVAGGGGGGGNAFAPAGGGAGSPSSQATPPRPSPPAVHSTPRYMTAAQRTSPDSPTAARLSHGLPEGEGEGGGEGGDGGQQVAVFRAVRAAAAMPAVGSPTRNRSRFGNETLPGLPVASGGSITGPDGGPGGSAGGSRRTSPAGAVAAAMAATAGSTPRYASAGTTPFLSPAMSEAALSGTGGAGAGLDSRPAGVAGLMSSAGADAMRTYRLSYNGLEGSVAMVMAAQDAFPNHSFTLSGDSSGSYLTARSNWAPLAPLPGQAAQLGPSLVLTSAAAGPVQAAGQALHAAPGAGPAPAAAAAGTAPSSGSAADTPIQQGAAAGTGSGPGSRSGAPAPGAGVPAVAAATGLPRPAATGGARGSAVPPGPPPLLPSGHDSQQAAHEVMGQTSCSVVAGGGGEGSSLT